MKIKMGSCQVNHTHHLIFPKNNFKILCYIKGFEDSEMMKMECQSYFIWLSYKNEPLKHARPRQEGDDAFSPQASVCGTWGGWRGTAAVKGAKIK